MIRKLAILFMLAMTVTTAQAIPLDSPAGTYYLEADGLWEETNGAADLQREETVTAATDSEDCPDGFTYQWRGTGGGFACYKDYGRYLGGNDAFCQDRHGPESRGVDYHCQLPTEKTCPEFYELETRDGAYVCVLPPDMKTLG